MTTRAATEVPSLLLRLPKEEEDELTTTPRKEEEEVDATMEAELERLEQELEHDRLEFVAQFASFFPPAK